MENSRNSLDDLLKKAYQAPKQETEITIGSSKNNLWMIPSSSVIFGVGALFSFNGSLDDYSFFNRVGAAAILFGLPSILYAALFAEKGKQAFVHFYLVNFAFVAGTYTNVLYENIINYFS